MEVAVPLARGFSLRVWQRVTTELQNMLPLIIPNSQTDEGGEKKHQPPNSDPAIEDEPTRSSKTNLAAGDPVTDDTPSRRAENKPSPSETKELLSSPISSHNSPPSNLLHKPSKLPDVENVPKHVTASARYYPRLGQKVSTTSWKEFQYQDHSLRINASEISAVTGFHPYRSLAKVLMNHVYQGRAGQELKDHDAKLLGIEFISEDQVLLELAKKAGTETSNALESAFRVKSGKTKLETVEIADKVKKKVLDEARKSKKLTKVELKQLEESARDSVNTGFGNAWEDKALNMYERQCGWEVRDRNVEVRTWSFRKDGDLSVTPMAPAYVPVRDRSRSHTLVPNPKRQKTQELVDLVCESSFIDGAETIPINESVITNDSIFQGEDRRDKPPYSDPPFFSIRGAVDGIREELAPSGKNPALTPGSPGDDSSWVLNRVIVECKHRMSRLQVSPPLYEQIQTTAYCLMYDVQDADIVQVLRKQVPRATRNKSKPKQMLPQGAPITQFFSSKSSEKENSVKGVQEQKAADVGSGNSSHGGEEKKSGVLKTNTDLAETPRSSGDTFDDVKDGQAPKPPVSVPCDSPQDQVQESSSLSAITTTITTRPVDNKNDAIFLEIGVNRVSLDDPMLQHRHNWNNIILPRLRSWTDAVYAIKRCDDKRYRLLQSMIEPPDLAQAWQILFDECPWLRHCDTAFHRDVAS